MSRIRTAFGLLVSLLLLVSLSSCGGSAGKSNNADAINALLGFQSAEGTKAAPLVLGNVESDGVVQHSGSVATGGLKGIGDVEDSYYLVQGITPGVDYTVTLAGLSDDADLYLFQNDPTFKQSPFSRVSTGDTTETFTVQAKQNTTSFFIGVDGSGTDKGAKYELSVFVKPVSEGTTSNPIALFVPDLRSGSTVAGGDTCCGIQATGDSYYVVTTTNSDTLITVSDMTDDVDLYVYDNAGIGVDAPLCQSTKVGTDIEVCHITAGADVYYIAVDGFYAAEGAAYRLNVIDAPTGTQDCDDFGLGTNGDDICIIGDAPQIIQNSNGNNFNTVLPGGTLGITPIDPLVPPFLEAIDSYYVVTGINAGKRYRVAMQDITDNAELYVFDRDSSYSTAVCKPPYDNPKVQTCTFTASGNAIYFAVDGFKTAAGAAFSLSVLPEFLAEGSADAPVNLGNVPVLQDLANIHTVLKDDDIGISGGDDSYFKVTGVSPGSKYIVSIPAMSDDVDLYVFNGDSQFQTSECSPYLGGTAAEQCIVTATSNTIYFAVDGYFTVNGAAYLVQVTALGSSGEGTGTVPGDTPKAIGSAPLDYAGFVIGTDNEVFPFQADATDSFYKVQVTSGRTYRVDLTGVTEDLDLYLFTSSNFSLSPACSSFEVGVVDETCQVTATSGFIYIAVDGDFAASGSVSPFTLSVVEKTLPVPVSVTVNAAAAAGSINWASDYGIGGPEDKYYSAAVSPGTTYRVQISNLTDDLDLYVFDADSNFQTNIDCPFTYAGGTTDEYCDVTATGTILYFGVDSYWMSGDSATFSISVVSPAP